MLARPREWWDTNRPSPPPSLLPTWARATIAEHSMSESGEPTPTSRP